jgi:ketosteroid isomerase-like protein
MPRVSRTNPPSTETALGENARTFRSLLEAGRPLEAIERFYAPDICVFENRTLARAGRKKCLDHEREQLKSQPKPPEFRFRRTAIDEAAGVVFFEYVVRFAGPEGRPLRLEEVAVQDWNGGVITEERFYYEGVVDEGVVDEGD